MWPFKTKLSKIKKQIDCNAKNLEFLVDKIAAFEKSLKKNKKSLMKNNRKQRENRERILNLKECVKLLKNR